MSEVLTPNDVLARTKAVDALRPGVQWDMEPDGTLVWNDTGSVAPSEAEIAAEIERQQVEGTL